MHRFLILAALAAVVTPLHAQPNPFKLPKSGVKAAQITYSLTGDITGTATVAIDGDRTARHQTSTMKMMGKTVNTDSWTLTTPDSSYSADLTKKQGTVLPNMLPHFSSAYEELDGDAKKRFHQNMEDMASLLSRAFSLASLNAGEKLGNKTYAGQECEERKLASFSICTMTKAPIMLHSQGSLVCLNFEETATEVKLAAPSGEAFATPAGITWKVDTRVEKPDSMAKGYVMYLASQQLSDSLAKAKAELEAAKAKQAQTGKTATLTPEQQSEMQKACDALKNFDAGKMLADATGQMKQAMIDEAKRAATDAAKNKIKGLFHKPKIP
jgi:hypothetical protein